MTEWEYKFVFKDNRMAPAFFDLIRGLKEMAGYRCAPKGQVVNIDRYYDTADLKLDSLGTVCRARNSGEGTYALVLKHQSFGPNREVVYPQTEPISVDEDGLKKVGAGEPPDRLSEIIRTFGRKKNNEGTICEEKNIFEEGRIDFLM